MTVGSEGSSRTRQGRVRPDLAAERLSDAELLVRVSRDDVEAYGVLYRRWSQRLAAFFYRRTSDWEASRDLTAETFAVVWVRRRRFRFRGVAGSAWLFGIARRELGRFRRRKGVEKRALARLGVRVPEWDWVSTVRVEEIVDAEAWRDRLDNGLAGLSGAERSAVQLRVVQDLSYAETAAALGCSEVAARVRVHRALRKLGFTIEPDPIEDGVS